MDFKHFIIIFPEISVVLLALVSQLAAVCIKDSARLIFFAVIVIILILIFLMLEIPEAETFAFNHSFFTNHHANLFKITALSFTLGSIIIYHDFCKIAATELKVEFITLTLLSTVGVFLSISSCNFLLLFCGLELQALAAYALACFNPSSLHSCEGALKYFILGALVTCLSLLGISFIYGFSGSLQFEVIFSIFNPQSASVAVALVVGIALMLSSIFFKLSAAPAHMWAPDVYQGTPIGAVTYISTVPKIGALAVLLNIIWMAIGNYPQITITLLQVAALLSMIIGSLGAIKQTSLKRLMAYSTILNIGYVLLGVSLNNAEGKSAAVVYMLIYLVGIIGFFACLVALLGSKADQATFNDIEGISSNRKTIASIIAIIMFSNIGVPPLAGFFGKYYLFYQAFVQGRYLLAMVGMLTSVIAAYYYLKIIKTMYFVEGKREIKRIPTSGGLLFVTFLSVTFILFFSFISSRLLQIVSF